ncbi:MAG TPA: hypothetical protein VK742_14055 [Candidatus Sulfotelmatobacter sp.]|nr:hypothetical protein [Candidatus Sulfotelmatobacter sp.]
MPITKLSIVLLLVVGSVSQTVLADEVILQDSKVLVAFDSDSGALTRMEDKSTHWVMERRPALGLSFRLFAPLPDRRYNPVFGQNQPGAEVKKLSDHEVQIQWTNLVSENGGVLSMALTADVTLTNGGLTFNAMLENDSPLTVETIDYPCFGDFNPPSTNTSLVAQTLKNIKTEELLTNEVYPHFRSEKGYWGVTYPTKMLEAQTSPFCLLQTPDQGLYVGLDAPKMDYHLQYTFEQHPGVISSFNNLVPQEDVISGWPVHLEFRLCHFIFAKPHSTTQLVPVALLCYQGDWHEGVNLYKQSSTSSGR